MRERKFVGVGKRKGTVHRFMRKHKFLRQDEKERDRIDNISKERKGKVSQENKDKSFLRKQTRKGR